MNDRPDSLDTLIHAARQVVQTERGLAGSEIPMNLNPLPPLQARAASQADLATGDQTPVVKGDMPTEEKARLLNEMDVNEVRGCTKCRLCQARTQTVFGDGYANADLMFIGEGPGADEDAQGKPFVGRAGQLLTKMIVAMGLSREQVYIANVVKCRPPENRPPQPDEAQACWSYLERQIRIIQPRVIVVLGNAASKALLHTETGITRLRGQWQELWGIPVMPTFHPAYLLRQHTEENRRKVWSDLQAAMAKLGINKKD